MDCKSNETSLTIPLDSSSNSSIITILQEEQQKREMVEQELYLTRCILFKFKQEAMLLHKISQSQFELLGRKEERIISLKDQLSDAYQQIQKTENLLKSEKFQFESDKFNSVDNNSRDPLTSLISSALLENPYGMPTPRRYPYVDWSLGYSAARLEEMLNVPEKCRNSVFYTVMYFHLKRLQELDNSEIKIYSAIIERATATLLRYYG